MFKKYLKLFNETEYSIKQYNSLKELEWIWFLETYENIFRFIEKSIFQWYFNLGNQFTILSKEKDRFGIYGLLDIKIDINQKSINAYLCHNVGVKKEYSGKGFFQLIGEKALEERLTTDNLALGFPNKASKKGHLRLGWEEIASMQFISYTSTNKEKIPLNDKYIFENVIEIPKSVDGLIDKSSSMFSLRMRKNCNFLTWRKSKPFSNYNVYLIKESKELVGYLVLKEYEEDNQRRLHLVDFLFTNIDVLNNLIKFTINQYKNNDYDLLNTWTVAKSLYEKVFFDCAFSVQNDTPIYPIILFQKESKFDFENIDKNKMFFTLFDNDVF